MKKIKRIIIPFLLILCLLLSGCELVESIFGPPSPSPSITVSSSEQTSSPSSSPSSILAYSGSPYVEINNNIPSFNSSDFTSTSFDTYSDLDSLGRCGVAYANIGQDIMPTGERGDIGSVKPSGWHTVKKISL